ncbi:MAG: glycosyltransferase family 2 protein [Dehalobacterium sp.]
MFTFIDCVNLTIFILFTVIYFYRTIYVIVGLLSKRKRKKHTLPRKLHKYAVLIAARNEQEVIGELIKSIKNQKYPKWLIDVFVVADNCTDDTAQRAREAGAIVFERYNQTYKGKGYALNFLLGKIAENYRTKKYEGYFVFDADNILENNYIYEMNKLFDKGYRVLTSYRNSKNYNHNWISAGYALWFLHEAEYINNPRMILKKSCAISGTGFLVHSDIIKRNGGWKHYLLTEDIEFTVSEVIKGEMIGYCGSAMLYDEQPFNFKQSWNQRLRWAKGFYQVFGRYGADLFKCCFQRKKQSFSCYDMIMTIMPAVLLSVTSTVVNMIFFVVGLLNPAFDYKILDITFSAICSVVIFYYSILFVLGLITTITEWKKIYCTPAKKILYLFTFPIFMFTYIPIAIAALFKKVEWEPIAHTCVKSLQDLHKKHSA